MEKIIKHPIFFLIIFFFIGLFLRINHLKDGSLTFSYDQARDAYIAAQINQGDLKIIGPPTSIQGFFHGVFYYYLIALPYHFSNGNPIPVAIFISVLNLLAIFPIYFLGKLLFNKPVAIISALIYAISFDIIQFSNWLSNPSPAVFFSAIFYLGLAIYLFSHQKILGCVLTAIGYSLCFQSQFFLGYLVIPIFILFFIFKTKINFKHFLTFSIITLLLTSSMILSYFKFGFTFIQGFQNLFTKNNNFEFQSLDFFLNSKLIIGRLVENFYRVIFPINSTFASIWAIFCFIFAINQIKSKSNFSPKIIFILVFLLSQLFIIPFGGQSTPYINVGLQIPLIFLSSLYLTNLVKTRKWLGWSLIFLFSLSLIVTNLKYNPKGQVIFAIQKELLIKNELAIIDYTYQNSHGQPFSINTLTCPYWINTLWSYLYQWYGQNKYGYSPYFHGRDQSGILSYLSPISSDAQYFYLIIEPEPGITKQLINDGIAYEDSFSKIIETKNFNGILVQKRQLTQPIEKINFVK